MIQFVLNHILESLSYTTMAQRPIIYHQNRDYSKQFEWSYESNEDLYRSLKKAKT